MRRTLLVVFLLSIGFLTGLAFSGAPRLDRAEPAAASAPLSPPATPVALPVSAPQTAAAPAVSVAGPDFTDVAARTVPTVTNISAEQAVRRRMSPFSSDPFFQHFFGGDDLFGGRSRPQQSLGSGVIVSADGYMVTNNHVIGDDVEAVTVVLADKREVPAKIIGTDQYTDLAVLKVDLQGLPVLPWGDSSKLRVAEWVMAVGNPFQFSQSVTLGVVSALGRNVGLSVYEDFIQTDAAINPGNSGGALVNARGELVGINTAIYSESGGYQGIGFAVPSNVARRVVEDLIRYGEVQRGSVGFMAVTDVTEYLARRLGAPGAKGVLVSEMRRDSQAYIAGIRPGDIIVSFNVQKITEAQQLQRAILGAKIGSTARVGIIRDGRESTVTVPIVSTGERRRRI
jgi:Do/DeqQ family serine protease